jgi:hypothetical protein
VPMAPREWFAIWLRNNPVPLTQVLNIPESSGVVTSSPATPEQARAWQNQILNSVPAIQKTVAKNIADVAQKLENQSEEVKKFSWLLPTAAAAAIALIKR